jgi:hypothetical protein
VSSGGLVLTAPRFVWATFANDPASADIDRFMNTIGHSRYWQSIGAEYGIGPATVGGPIHLQDSAPTAIEMIDVDAWVQSRFDGTHPEWGAPDPATIYTIFYPSGTSVTSIINGVASCVQMEGYHIESRLANGTIVSYAVVVRCDSLPDNSSGLPLGLDEVTSAASHELIEAATDPHPISSPAYFQADDYAWSMAGQEVGDLCVGVTPPSELYTRPAEIGYLVQRTWSNAAARAGHDPCVPEGSNEAYFNSAPSLDELLPVIGRQPGDMAHGVQIPVGSSKTIDVKLFSDGPTSGAWNVEAIDLAQKVAGDPQTLAFSFDRSSGMNGDVLKLTITVVAAPPKDGRYELFSLQSTLGDMKTVWYGMVENPQ